MNSPLTHVKPSVVMEQHKHLFTKSEQKIYAYILGHPEQVIYHSLTEFSDACGVAEATALRFLRKLGYKGFQDFKFLFAREIAEAGTDQGETYLERIRENMVQAIRDTHNVVNHDELSSSIEAIDRSDDVVIFGIGSSGIAGLDMQHRLMRIGKHTSVVTDSHFQMMRAASLNEKSVVIAISLTGGTKDIVDAVRVAKEKKARVVALTNYVKSPLTKYADHILLTSAKESPLDSGSLVSKVAQLYLVDLICTGLTMKNYEEAERVKREVSDSISGKLY
ncbi:MurR/RpiR family transcriptional regulator [Bhargavaea beijingensis]|uniref:MurR/RpiR family transcriptional regulator n=1 Tax=Bhargavaea beijingensis TaxID=426756 RepID=A0A1G6ZZY2_9BACL|nr:MurR/RpiR family transcriptional regulator [Bhargavaea beijingensis]MCW1927242.1 MurR/RpiR family transcriptional regulator [Bhargavaea beijingensis]RSK35624.1 MurR/RpiR family transcriptional regulator [Bhargavaea beijingensis]SDE08238.1 transcriptional regulator, RpiR family [Bhargavaea beijingensis]